MPAMPPRRRTKVGGYADDLRPLRTLTLDEADRILRATGAHRDGFRDHVLFAVALSTGLRQHEITGLDWSDVATPAGTIRKLVPLRVYKRSNDDAAMQEARLADPVRRKLERLRENNRRDGLPSGDGDPVFVSARRQRLSERGVRFLFARWQVVAGLDRHLSFHSLRHTACTRLYEATGGDLRLVQRFARHASVRSTERYTHPSDERLARAVDLIAV